MRCSLIDHFDELRDPWVRGGTDYPRKSSSIVARDFSAIMARSRLNCFF
jgi:hypothetical protein